MADVFVHKVPQLVIIVSCTKQRALETTANIIIDTTHTQTHTTLSAFLFFIFIIKVHVCIYIHVQLGCHTWPCVHGNSCFHWRGRLFLSQTSASQLASMQFKNLPLAYVTDSKPHPQNSVYPSVVLIKYPLNIFVCTMYT